MTRSIAAIVAGLVWVVVLSVGTDLVLEGVGVVPPMGSPLTPVGAVIAVVQRTVWGVTGGYLTARLAPRRPMAHALVLGAIGFVAATVGAVATWGGAYGPVWYPLALVALAIPQSWLGGQLRVARLSRASGPASGAA